MMKRVLASMLALAVAAPGPSFAQTVSVEAAPSNIPVLQVPALAPVTSLAPAYAATALTAQAPLALSSLAPLQLSAAASAPPTAGRSAAAQPLPPPLAGEGRVGGASSAAPIARSAASRATAATATAQAQALGLSIKEGTPDKALVATFDGAEAAKGATIIPDAPPLRPSVVAPRRSLQRPLGRALAFASGLATMAVVTAAQAMPDGYEPPVRIIRGHDGAPMAQGDPGSPWVGLAILVSLLVVPIVFAILANRSSSKRMKKALEDSDNPLWTERNTEDSPEEKVDFRPHPVRDFVNAIRRGGRRVFRRGAKDKDDGPSDTTPTAAGAMAGPSDSAAEKTAPEDAEKAAKKGAKTETEKKITFEDVAGQDDAKKDMQKVVSFLKNPEKYRKLKAKGYKGVLEVGPPGSGKTLLAQAVANEAGVPFYEMSGSKFVEKFVGVGSSRVRELFDKARSKKGPAIIFIDEIDAMGKKRSEDGSGNQEWEQTLNELLVQMSDQKNRDIVVIAATNRPDMLDPALLRRFGLKIPVGLPDVAGRQAIFKVHMRGMPLTPDVEIRTLAKDTPGLSGSDIENIVNDAAMAAAERDADAVSMSDLTGAIDRWTIGHEQKGKLMSASEKRITAYHESGHALVSHLLPDADPVRKVTIVPHGLQALGLVQSMPEEDKNIVSREWLMARIAVAFGGRVAEEMMTGQVYSGASNDIESATKLARLMVTKFGMSKVGPISHDMDGEAHKAGRPLSEREKRLIDSEVRRILMEGYQLAVDTLTPRKDTLEAMKVVLMDVETLRAEDLERLVPRPK